MAAERHIVVTVEQREFPERPSVVLDPDERAVLQLDPSDPMHRRAVVEAVADPRGTPHAVPIFLGDGDVTAIRSKRGGVWMRLDRARPGPVRVLARVLQAERGSE